jgi:hypothetical protein
MSKYVWRAVNIHKFFSKNIKVISKNSDKITEGSSVNPEGNGKDL